MFVKLNSSTLRPCALRDPIHSRIAGVMPRSTYVSVSWLETDRNPTMSAHPASSSCSCSRRKIPRRPFSVIRE
uniref:Major head subunit n=1 Tax=uncultured marine virus TaxID=186617 RepID=A0A0F7L2D1_9VIRU|nr:major head subunit [uncultured marine virus]